MQGEGRNERIQMAALSRTRTGEKTSEIPVQPHARVGLAVGAILVVAGVFLRKTRK